MPHSLRPLLSRARTAWWWLAGVWLALGALLAGFLSWDREEVATREREHLAQQVAIIHDNLARQLTSINAVLARLADEPVPAPSDPVAHQYLNARLRAFGEALSGVRTLSVLAADGTVVASDRPELIGKNFAYRPYFQATRDATDPDTLIVGAPFRAVLDGGWYLMLGRAVRGPDGRFAGAVMATLDPAPFLTLLESVRYAPDMVTGLAHGDGVRFLMASELPQAPGADLAQPGTLFSRHRDSGASTSVLRGSLQPGDDAPQVLGALRTIQPPELRMDKPFIAGAVREWSAVLEGWRTGARWLIGAYLLLGAAAAAALRLYQRQRFILHQHALALAEQEAQLQARWRAAMQATTLGIWEWHGEGTPTRFSPAWKEMLGYDEGEVADEDHGWQDRLHPDEREQVLALLARHLRGETQLYEAMHRLRRKDGSWRWVQARGRVLARDAQGRVTHFVGAFGDPSEQGEDRLRLDRLAAQVPGTLYQYQLEPDGSSHFPYASAGVQDIYGFSPDELRANGTLAFERIHPQDAAQVSQSIDASARTLQPWHDEYRVVLPGRGERWLSGYARPQRLASGALLWHGYLRDVTDAKQQALQLQETERLLKHLMNEMPVGLCMVDEQGRIYFRNRRFLDYFGYTEEQAPTMREWWRCAYPDAQYRTQVALTWSQARAQARAGGDIPVHEYRTTAADGVERTMAIGGLVFGSHFLATFVDRTEQQVQSELLRKLAYMDSLTGVANRRHFDQTLQTEWRRCQRSRQPLALIMVDIDHFKQFNDLYGHQAGDDCMRAVAGALRAALARPYDLVARYGGEEFVCLLPECDLAGARAKGQALCEAVRALAITHGGSAVAGVVTISAGVASQVPGEDGTPEALLAHADTHLYRAKAAGRNRVDAGAPPLSNP
ncbi:diguanylate cyclase domain-containing protein [Pulveribacter suum]|uniref:Diguanylate cyclase n=1 Tax=Pulveribacter suum TaxID=2116657 RepID=A0A2P1NHG5_9BURK|nr:diguanylate cyclase [Pulveribacter suum]AVP56493.1 diguanylate cyclase [Pulveribacter suum]